MPTVFRHDAFRFFFYSNEGDPREPIHVHVMQGAGEQRSGFGQRCPWRKALGSMRGRCGEWWHWLLKTGM